VALDIRGCTKRFRSPSGDNVLALDGVSLSVGSGAVVAIVGSNGAGKSTLLSAIAGSSFPDSGSISIRGREVTELPSWKRTGSVAVVRQNPQTNVLGGLTIEENFALARVGRGRASLGAAGGRKVRAEAAKALAQFDMGLEDRLSARTATLSGGQRQAVAIAMATLHTPDVLLLDEHVAALDPKSARLVTEKSMQFIRKAGITTLMVSHDMQYALEHSDRLLMMHRGSIVMDLGSEEKDALTVPMLIERFESLSGEALPDRMVL